MQPINIYGDHATCCTKSGDLIIRHNTLRNLLAAIARDGLLNPILEKQGILGPTTGRRPGDVTIPNWREGDFLAIDVAVTSPLINSSVRLEEPCEEYARTQKHAKYDSSFVGTNYAFCAMVFETLGAISKEGEEVLRQIFRFAARQLGREFSSYCGRTWARLSCSLQRSVAQSILNRIDGSKNERRLEDFSVDLDPGTFVSDEDCFGKDLEWEPQKPVIPNFPVAPLIPNFPGPTPGSSGACQPAVRLQEKKEIERVSETETEMKEGEREGGGDLFLSFRHLAFLLAQLPHHVGLRRHSLALHLHHLLLDCRLPQLLLQQLQGLPLSHPLYPQSRALCLLLQRLPSLHPSRVNIRFPMQVLSLPHNPSRTHHTSHHSPN